MFFLAEETASILDAIPAEYVKWIVIILGIAKVAEVIVKLTPTKTDDKILRFLTPIFKWLSLNVPDVEEVKKKDDKKK